MRWNGLALALVLLLGPSALAQPPAVRGTSAVGASDSSAQALSVYEEGKHRYDAGDYAGALDKFTEAANLEPNTARWQYNRGLALRKLKRFKDAREALLRCRALDPAYKTIEIDDKLREMGFGNWASTGSARAPSGSSKAGQTAFAFFFILCIAIPLFVVLVLANVTRKKSRDQRKLKQRTPRRGSSKPRESQGPPRTVDVSPLDQRMDDVADRLIAVEHALRLEEDGDLRALLNQATMAEQRARAALEKARRGAVPPESVEPLVRAAENDSAAASESARSLFGDSAFLPEGERIGCYFCARPLANASFRKQVPLKHGSEVTPVLACPPCANMVAAGQPPKVQVRAGPGGQRVHWSELDGYDPYTHRHKHYPGTRLAPPWDFTPQRSLAEVAALAAGGALVGGLAAYGVSQLLDLDSARETAAAQAAAQAAARRTSERREDRDWRDHS